MKTRTTDKGKGARAAVVFVSDNTFEDLACGDIRGDRYRDSLHRNAVLAVPFPSPASAKRALKNFWGLSEEGQVEALAKKLAASAYKCAMDEWVPGGCMNEPRKPNADDLKWYARHCRALLALIKGDKER